MKRLLILATAAIVALASCSKTQVVYTDAPEEIAFKQVTNVMTKVTAGLANQDMSVFAYVGGTSYFGNTEFAYNDGKGAYVASAAKYWPASGDVDFIVWAPYDADVTSASATQLAGISKDTDEQIDVLYGTVSASKQDAAVNVDLNHALSLVQINIAGSENVKLMNVELLNSVQKATAEVNTAADPAVEWTPDATNPKKATVSLYTPTDNVNGDALDVVAKPCTDYIVVPVTTNNATIKLSYKMGSDAAVLTYETAAALGEWEPGMKYVYNISVGATEIKLNPVAPAQWGDGGTVNNL